MSPIELTGTSIQLKVQLKLVLPAAPRAERILRAEAAFIGACNIYYINLYDKCRFSVVFGGPGDAVMQIVTARVDEWRLTKVGPLNNLIRIVPEASLTCTSTSS
jgi:hypothetical protein